MFIKLENAKLYVYKKGDPKPVLPAYTYTEVGWNPNLTFLNYRGKTYIDNVDVKTKAQSTYFVYDDFNRLTKVAGQTQGEGVTTYTYDNKNQLVKVKKEYPDTDLIPDSWQAVNLEPGDGRSAEFAKEGKYSLKIVGNSTKTKSVKQNVATSGNAGDALTFSGWNKTINSSTAGKCVVALFYFNNKDGSRKYAGYLGRGTLLICCNVLAQLAFLAAYQ